MSDEEEVRIYRSDIAKVFRGCAVMLGVCSVLLLIAYLCAFQPWLPLTEPEIQQIAEQRFPGMSAHLKGFLEDRGNCRIVIVDVDGLTWYLEVQRVDGHWKYVDYATGAGLWPYITCPR